MMCVLKKKCLILVGQLKVVQGDIRLSYGHCLDLTDSGDPGEPVMIAVTSPKLHAKALKN